jgi:hypothetical protein
LAGVTASAVAAKAVAASATAAVATAAVRQNAKAAAVEKRAKRTLEGGQAEGLKQQRVCGAQSQPCQSWRTASIRRKSRKMRRRSRNKGQRKKRIWRQWISAEGTCISHAVLDI